MKLLVIHPHDGHHAGDTIELTLEEYEVRKAEHAFPYYHVLTPEQLEAPVGAVEFVEGDLPLVSDHASMTGTEVALMAEEVLNKVTGKKKKVAEE
jgi:hypothetical protein